MVCCPESMIIEIIKVLLGRGVNEHNASIRPIIIFDSGWRGILLITQVMFIYCDWGGCEEKEADVLINFSEYLDAIWPTLWQAKYSVFQCPQSPRSFAPQVQHSFFSRFFLSELGGESFSVSFLFSWSLSFSLDLKLQAKFTVFCSNSRDASLCSLKSLSVH